MIAEDAIHVLHIEDHEMIARMVADSLTSSSVGTYQVHRAGSHAEGLQYAHEHSVDAILLDLNLPDSRGVKGVSIVRAALPGVPIVVLSSEGDRVTRRAALDMGADAFIDKADLNPVALDACLRISVRLSQARKECSQLKMRLTDKFTQVGRLVLRLTGLHNPDLVEHALRVSQIGTGIAMEMGLSDECIAAVQTAGALHEAGRNSMSTDLFAASGGLHRPSDWCKIGKQLEDGAAACGCVDWPWPIPEIILQQYERLDGTGMPNRLQGSGILLQARILAVADVFDRYAHPQQGFAEFGIDVALAHLRSGRGSRYDADVVDSCCRIFEVSEKHCAAKGETGGGAGPKLLIIDDEPSMGRSVERALRYHSNCSVSLAFNGESGLRMAKQKSPELILLDVRMPGMDGLDTLCQLKLDPETEAVPVIMLTAVDDDSTRAAALAARADDYICKPVAPEQIRALVSSRFSTACA
jgi:putative two-component system response regulator